MQSLRGHKLKREISRIGRQFITFPKFLISYLFSTPFYDLVLSRKCKYFDGKVALKDRVAIYLFYPKNGLLTSHIRSIEYLKNSGYSPLLICNATLNDEDRKKVLQMCWRYIERPNFGYDFGGYRDAVLSIKAELSTLESLILVNDSTWFPLPNAMDWIAESEALDVDYAGAAWAWAVKHKDPEQFEKVRWIVNKERKNFHYASYALNIAKPILSSKKFYRFWKGFRLSNDKKRTVRRGEIGLTAWVIKHGFSHGSTTDLDDLDQHLSTKSDDEIRNIIDNLICVTDPEMKHVANKFLSKFKSSEDFPRASAELLILNAVARQGASYSILGDLIKNYDFAFMKKSPALHSNGTETAFRNALETTGAEFRSEVIREIEILKS